MDYPNGAKYKGDFEDGYRSGYGFYYYYGGDYYMGEWKNDKKEGVGTYYYADGTYFCALRKDNEPVEYHHFGSRE